MAAAMAAMTCGATCSGVTQLMLWQPRSWSASISATIRSGGHSAPTACWLMSQFWQETREALRLLMGSRWEMPRRRGPHHNDPAASRSTRPCPRPMDFRSVAFAIFPCDRIKCRAVSPGSRGHGPKRQRWYAVLPGYDPEGSPLGPEALFADPTAGGEPEVSPRAGERWSEKLSAPDPRSGVRSAPVMSRSSGPRSRSLGPPSARWTRRLTTPLLTSKRGSNA